MFDRYIDNTAWLCNSITFFHGPFGMLLNILLWGLVIMLVVKGISYLFGISGRSGSTTSRPVEILRERYARGEITKIEFEQMKKDLA